MTQENWNILDDDADLFTLTQQIHSGQADEFLDRILDAVKERKSQVREVDNREQFLSLSPGDEVEFNDHCRPKYIRGMRAVVVNHNRTKIVVRLTETRRRYAEGTEVVTPVSILNKVGG